VSARPIQSREVAKTDPASPVDEIPDGRTKFDPDALALCLSGGGYRAMLFHLGALWRLNELGVLPTLGRVSGVSGGSITAAVLGSTWQRLEFDAAGVSPHFVRELVEPLRALASRTIDAPAIVTGILLPSVSIGDRLEAAYRSHLFGDATLADLPTDSSGPRFVLNATNMQTHSLFRFTRAYVADWRIGRMHDTRKIPLALAVAASSAFPPFLSPVKLHLSPSDWTAEGELQQEPYTTEVVLTDGGVYDNLGLETAFKRCGKLLVSDGGKRLAVDPEPNEDWGRHSARTALMMKGQLESIRKRQLIGAFQQTAPKPLKREGTYWGIGSDVSSYAPVHEPIPFAPVHAKQLADTSTRLEALNDRHQIGLVDWGYAICDTAMRRWVMPGARSPDRLPYSARDAYAEGMYHRFP
jgi:NTE family protein